MIRRASVFAAVVLVFVAASAAPAFAHAGLVSTTPAAGSVLAQSPPSIQLQFTESVTVALGGIRVYDQQGDRVDTGPPTKPSGSSVEVAVRGTLADGAYIVTWRVTSADTHPVQGAFTFQVGTAANATSRQVTGLADRLLAGQKGAGDVGVAWGVTRFLAFAGIALFVGSVVFCVLVWPGARDRRGARRIMVGSGVLLVVATVVGFALQGPYAAGQGLGHVVDVDLWRDVARTRFGTVWLGRLGLLAVALALVGWLLRRRPAADHPVPRWWLAVGAVVGVGIVLTPAFSGHSDTGDVVGLAVAVSGVHVGAMSVWLGGLVVLGAVALRGDDVDAGRAVVERFSRFATWCVVALIASGAFQTWRQVRSLDGLRTTDFGKILMVKLLVFVAMTAFAVFSRELVHRVFWQDRQPRELVVSGAAVDDALDGGADDDLGPLTAEELEAERRYDWRNLRRSVWAEATLGLVVLAVTAVLVNATPPVNAAAASNGAAAGVTMRSPKVVVDVTVAPAQAGPTDVHVSTFTAAGAPLDVAELEISFDLADRKIAPIDVPLRKLGPGHYLSPGFTIPLPGDWRVVSKARLNDIDEVTQAATITIR